VWKTSQRWNKEIEEARTEIPLLLTFSYDANVSNRIRLLEQSFERIRQPSLFLAEQYYSSNIFISCSLCALSVKLHLFSPTHL
jgi:hypothetical protein